METCLRFLRKSLGAYHTAPFPRQKWQNLENLRKNLITAFLIMLCFPVYAIFEQVPETFRHSLEQRIGENAKLIQRGGTCAELERDVFENALMSLISSAVSSPSLYFSISPSSKSIRKATLQYLVCLD